MGAETEGCSATKAAAPSPSNVKKTIFTRCKMASSLRLRPTFPLILSLSPLEAYDLDRFSVPGPLGLATATLVFGDCEFERAFDGLGFCPGLKHFLGALEFNGIEGGSVCG
jgi:hypothetical protein